MPVCVVITSCSRAQSMCCKLPFLWLRGISSLSWVRLSMSLKSVRGGLYLECQAQRVLALFACYSLSWVAVHAKPGVQRCLGRPPAGVGYMSQLAVGAFLGGAPIE